MIHFILAEATDKLDRERIARYIVSYMLRIELIQAKRQDILGLAREHGVVSIQVFGSVARKEDTEKSDIDFLVEFSAGWGLLNQFALQRKLEKLLNCKVDVVSRGSLKPRIRENIIREAVSL